jgi:hypothetical protein
LFPQQLPAIEESQKLSENCVAPLQLLDHIEPCTEPAPRHDTSVYSDGFEQPKQTPTTALHSALYKAPKSLKTAKFESDGHN